MKVLIENNIMKAKEFVITGENILPEIAVVKSVRLSYKLDEQGKKTDTIDFIRYDCINPDNYSTFTLKVESNHAVVTQEILESADEPIYISIPVSESRIRPYAISYGNVSVTVGVPYVKLVHE